jgi:hypothetical protein
MEVGRQLNASRALPSGKKYLTCNQVKGMNFELSSIFHIFVTSFKHFSLHAVHKFPRRQKKSHIYDFSPRENVKIYLRQ